MRKHLLSTSISLILFFGISTSVWAAEEEKNINNQISNVLPVISLKAESGTDQYVATQARSLLKSDAPLFETAQSVSVITREQLDQKQATTLAEAINGVAGVVSGSLGRRGWDDFIIRGQTSSDQVLIDGLRQGAGSFVAVDLSGMDQVQILKGPASVNFGLVQPGGIVNLVTKRPQAENFARTDLTYGRYNFKQGTFDLNYAPNESEKGAFRLTGRISDQDDPTDYVYFKNFYISPSYNFNIGNKAELSIITSYQHREYMRQQGLPFIGTIKDNPNGKLPKNLYIGEPSYGHYNADVYRTGYTFKYAFENGWNYNQNFAIQKTKMIGPAVFYNGWADKNFSTLKRQGRYLDVDNLNVSIDNNLQKQFTFDKVIHDLSIGIDGLQDKNDYLNNRCTVPNLNLYAPQYGQNVNCPEKVTNHDINRLKYVGIYIRDRIKINDQLILNLAGRQDWAENSTRSIANNGTTSKQNDQKFTGNASLMYTVNDMVAPYISYATSFFPTTGTDAQGNLFKPEQGKQTELGLKLQSPDKNIQGSIAWYDLRRQNVLVTDPQDNTNKVQRGEQLSRGVETEVTANLSDTLKVSASYTYMSDAKTSKDTQPTNIGLALDNIPKHAYSLSTRYRPLGNNLGWYIGAGVHGETHKTVRGLDVNIPTYTVFDTEAGYDANHWGAQLSIRNLFDKDYYAGSLNSNMVTLGNPRQINFTVKLKY